MRSIIFTLILSALSVHTIPIPSPLDDARGSQPHGLSLLDKRETAEIFQNGGDIVWTLSNNQEEDRASDGGVFAYGDSNFYGSMGSAHLDSPEEGTRVKRNSELNNRDDAVGTNVKRGFITVDVIPEDTDQTPAFDALRRSEKGSCLTCAKRYTSTVVEVQNQTPTFDVRSVRNSRVSFVRDTSESIDNTGSEHDDVFVHWSRQSAENDPVKAQGFDCSGRSTDPDIDTEDDVISWKSTSQHDWDKRSSNKEKRMERANAKTSEDHTDEDIVRDGEPLKSGKERPRAHGLLLLGRGETSNDWVIGFE
ncbi:hypothetical protein V865_007728 [Kwoniella europaea PYCC6329]|uniref:Uncharacterized protein n=1 Tax=Kwoniella europaea PYCC6329 TaxID=1423913 RepID=A0AAX4KVH7_9TREE